jgi:23S rRNA (cytosine1962-C5)-methyltransferase
VTRVSLKKNEDRRIKGGHPWVFSNEIGRIEGASEPGTACELFDVSGNFIGTGYHNAHSLISVRLLSRKQEDIDSVGFFEERIAAALAHRRSLYPQLETFRLIYGESDFLPGLVVDKYGDYLSLQLLSAGMDRRRGLILEALQRLLSPKGIIARNDVAVRTMEGMTEEVELLQGAIPDAVLMQENGLTFEVDLRHGQKTGGFLDQKENHLLLQGISKDKDVLDCFCYSGSWAAHAGFFGARSVLGLDISERAVALAGRNAALNGLSDRVSFEECDAFDRLRSLKLEGRSFGVVVLDPPAFVKNRKNLAEATKGYITINRRALELLEPGGYLITCSCSYHMGREPFREMLATSARQAKREVRLVRACSQAPDHPVLLNFPESEYLKCVVLQAI